MSVLAALAAAAIFGTPAACEPGAAGNAALVTVHGFKDREGQLRIAIYPANEADFLAPARYVQRIDVPLTPEGEMTVCAPVPAAGQLIITALHDRDLNGKLSPFRDGVGFSRNPKLGLGKPKVAAVAIAVDGVTPVRIELNYLQGLSVAPVRARQTR
ncbi:DUF2141 domain-containing protein [Sandaracinobacter neustonicus]|uniref:DUF2141 domain-containing protein n=1 Tax=Sandaracinobacter neustonicus TaxID=1715348 RepID=A0A501XK62_9SPHN|nr:DUF2141 domain-containing protein [Sandaracinobacter neustonicus]TPE61051.1 DUF2141 domain-containing protein [Sandaracinobacter neustonicus]